MLRGHVREPQDRLLSACGDVRLGARRLGQCRERETEHDLRTYGLASWSPDTDPDFRRVLQRVKACSLMRTKLLTQLAGEKIFWYQMQPRL